MAWTSNLEARLKQDAWDEDEAQISSMLSFLLNIQT